MTDRGAMRRTGPVGRALLGAGSGLGATVAMSGVMLAAQWAGLVDEQPPERVVEAGLEAAGVPDPDRVEPATTALAVVAHVGYGMLLGALFALAQPRRASTLRGAAFGVTGRQRRRRAAAAWDHAAAAA